MTNDELLAQIEAIEERIEVQILTLQVLREHLVDLLKRANRAKEDLV